MNNPFSARYLRPGVLPYFFPDNVTLSTLDDGLWASGGWAQIVGPHGTGKSTLLEQWCERLEEQGVVVQRLRFQSMESRSTCHPPFRASGEDSGRVASRRAGRGEMSPRWLVSMMKRASVLFSAFAALVRFGVFGTLDFGRAERKEIAEGKGGVTLLPSPSLRLRPSRNSLVPREREGDRQREGDERAKEGRRLVVIDGYEQLRWWERRLVEGWLKMCGVGLLVTTHEDVGLNTIWQTPSSSRLAHKIANHLGGSAGGGIPFEVVDQLWRESRGDIRETLFALYDWIESNVAVIAAPA